MLFGSLTLKISLIASIDHMGFEYQVSHDGQKDKQNYLRCAEYRNQEVASVPRLVSTHRDAVRHQHRYHVQHNSKEQYQLVV